MKKYLLSLLLLLTSCSNLTNATLPDPIIIGALCLAIGALLILNYVARQSSPRPHLLRELKDSIEHQGNHDPDSYPNDTPTDEPTCVCVRCCAIRYLNEVAPFNKNLD